MISSTSPSDRAARAVSVPASGQPAVRPQAPRQDQLSTDSIANLKIALQRQPEIRPEMVEKGRQLVTDSTYPALAIIKNIAAQIVSAPDLSEEEQA